MAKHSEQGLIPTQVSYTLNNSRLRFSRFQLSICQSSGEWVHHIFDDGPVKIGALLNDCQIVLTDETVSRRHCQVLRDGDHYVLQDLQSTNGTFLGGVRIKEIYLEPGVEFMIGQVRAIFNRVKEEVSITPSLKNRLGRIVGGDIKMREIFTVIDKISHTDTTVIIEGETGTGKDVVARTIHETSRRSTQPFVVFDCSAVPEHLIESELFGHEKGSFTGAIMARQGLFELANGGTIFLDELGELSLELQPKLLRVLENRQIRRVGSSRSTTVDVRVIAATNRHLEEEVKNGRFREDLFYRLSVVRLFLPPLRDRISDLPLLIEHFLSSSTFNVDHQGQPKLTGVDAQSMEVLFKHKWPGNVRELINVLERACSFAEDHTIHLSDLPPMLLQSSSEQGTSVQNALNTSQMIAQKDVSDSSLSPEEIGRVHAPQDVIGASQDFENFKDAKDKWISLFERDYILTALNRTRYNISHAAREADIDRKYFRKLMHKYEIEVP
jgi:transcriptional regulator with GAF, ATPase, and Fis domain